MMERYSPQYPLTFQVIELTRYDKILRFIMFIAFFAYLFSVGSSLNSTIRIICFAILLIAFIGSALIRKRKKHYAEKGKMVLYDDRAEMRTETGIEKIMLSENTVNANIREYTSESPSWGTLSWVKGEVGNTITFTNGSKQTKYYFFLDNESHAKMLVRRFQEWKKGGIDCAWKVSDAVL